ncbi:MAG TPA: hypothetical protein VHM24_13425 [Gemmatimonadaceae bacterium]|nr:hypothetical protein [Gemmatimonadaceae bacterium]
MRRISNAVRGGLASIGLFVAMGCSSTGGLGGVLGSVLGGGGGASQVSGTVQQINTRNQQIGIQQSNGQTVTLTYDNNTQVVYQNRNYQVSSLEYGDRVTARITNGSGNNSGYYTDLIQVDQSVTGSGAGSVSGNVQSFEGTVRNIDRTNGLFSLESRNFGTVTVSLPYNPRQGDLNRFQSLRSGDYVRIYGIPLNNSRVELREFY